MTRDEVLKEYAFDEFDGYWGESHTAYHAASMADEIVRLRRILAALREPSEAVMQAAVRDYSGDLRDAIRAAVAAAEVEADR